MAKRKASDTFDDDIERNVKQKLDDEPTIRGGPPPQEQATQTDTSYYQYGYGYDSSYYYQQPPSSVTTEEQTDALSAAAAKKAAQAAAQEEEGKRKRIIREAAGQKWEDPSLYHWPKDDFRVFAGNLGNDVTDDSLRNAFAIKYKSCTMAHVVRDKRTGKTKGYGFVSFLDAHEFITALKEMNGKYIGGRPCKLTKSKWDDRNVDSEKRKKKKQAINKLTH